MSELAWETLAAEVAYSCPGFDVIHEDVRLPDGTETDYDYLDEPPAAVVLGFTPEGEVVLIEEWRQPVGRVNCGLPAGSMEGAESPERAARREFEEETGYVADSMERLLATEPANGVTDTVHHHFLARGCTPDGERDLDGDEEIEVGTVGFDDLIASVLAGDVRDGRTALTVLYHAANRNLG